MNHERETLQRQLREINSKNAEAWQASQEVEMTVTRTMDKFDNLMSEYVSFGHQIGTLTATADGVFAGPGGVDFTIDCDVSGEDVNEIQASGKKMRDVIRPALNKYDEQIRDLTKGVGEAQAGLDEESDKLILAVEKQKSDASNKELELAKKNGEAEAAKAVSLKCPTVLISSYMYKKRQICKSLSANLKMKCNRCRQPLKPVLSRHSLI